MNRFKAVVVILGTLILAITVVLCIALPWIVFFKIIL